MTPTLMVVIVNGSVIDAREERPLKTLVPRVVMPDGSIINTSNKHP